MLRSRRVNPELERVFKFSPRNPPRRGEIVLVDDVRCRVTRVRVKWNADRWTLRLLKVKPA